MLLGHRQETSLEQLCDQNVTRFCAEIPPLIRKLLCCFARTATYRWLNFFYREPEEMVGIVLLLCSDAAS